MAFSNSFQEVQNNHNAKGTGQILKSYFYKLLLSTRTDNYSVKPTLSTISPSEINMRSCARPVPTAPLPKLCLSWSRSESQGLPVETTETAASPLLLRSPSRFLHLRSPAFPPALEELQQKAAEWDTAGDRVGPRERGSSLGAASASPHCKESTGQSRAKLTASICPSRARWLVLMLCQNRINTKINETLSPSSA